MCLLQSTLHTLVNNLRNVFSYYQCYMVGETEAKKGQSKLLTLEHLEIGKLD
jgi:hypothetical protein